MEHTTEGKSRVTPKDFFLWAGAMLSLYVGIFSLVSLIFEYINFAFPDPLAYSGDPYSEAVRFGMASLFVLVPTVLFLMHLIRKSIEHEPGKAEIWVRKWAIMLTLFAAGATIVIDLITLVDTFLGGEISVRFGLKVAAVLLVAVLVFLHFLADFKGYWIIERKKARLIGVASGVMALLTVIAGFFIIGSPMDARLLRFDEEKVSDLQSIQSQLTYHYQQKERLPEALSELNDALSGYTVPVDTQSNSQYQYEKLSNLSFKLCATFNKESIDRGGQGGYKDMAISYPTGGISDTWYHGAGEVCFTRTIDPELYPVHEKGIR
jgi:hypothetical protein